METGGGGDGRNWRGGGRGNGRRGGTGRRVGRGTEKAMVREEDVSSYGKVEEDGDGNATLPSDFLPNIVDNLPEAWYYGTYKYYPYFDLNQRDGNGNISVPPELALAVPANVDKWKECAKLLGDHTFKETGKLEYGYEIGQIASADGYNFGPKQSGGRTGCLDAECSSAMAMKYLFKYIAPELIEQDRITELIAIVYRWHYVPCLESNNKWLLQAIADHFLTKGAKVVLSENVFDRKRQHTVLLT